MLRRPSQNTWKWGGIPHRLDGSILSLTPLESHQPLCMNGLDDLDLSHFHLDIVDFLVERRETGIHPKMECGELARDGRRAMREGGKEGDRTS